MFRYASQVSLFGNHNILCLTHGSWYYRLINDFQWSGAWCPGAIHVSLIIKYQCIWARLSFLLSKHWSHHLAWWADSQRKIRVWFWHWRSSRISRCQRRWRVRGELWLEYIRLLLFHLFETHNTCFLLFLSWFHLFGGLSLQEQIALKWNWILESILGLYAYGALHWRKNHGKHPLRLV